MSKEYYEDYKEAKAKLWTVWVCPHCTESHMEQGDVRSKSRTCEYCNEECVIEHS